MRKFNYRFHKIEDLRTEQLKIARKELKNIRDELKSEKKALALLAEHQDDYRSKLIKKSSEFLDLKELNWYKDYLHLLEEKIKEKKEVLKTLRRKLIQLKKLAGKREKEKKSLEKAKELKFAIFLSEQNKAEQKELDEIGRAVSSKRF